MLVSGGLRGFGKVREVSEWGEGASIANRSEQCGCMRVGCCDRVTGFTDHCSALDSGLRAKETRTGAWNLEGAGKYPEGEWGGGSGRFGEGGEKHISLWQGRKPCS